MPLKCLKRYRVQDLAPGMVLGKTILNDKGQVMLDQGKVILQEGTLITRELIDRLRNWNICVVDVQITLPTSSAKSTEEEAPSAEKLEADMLERMAGGESLSLVLDRLAQGIGQLYPTDNVFVTLLDGNRARWWVIASAGSFRLPDVATEQKFQGQAYLTGQAVTIGELSMHKGPPVLARADMLSMCGIPIIVDGMTVGVLELFSRTPNAFASEEEAALKRYARLAAGFIHCTRTHELLRQTSDERDLLYEIMGFVSATMPPAQLLSKVADNLSNYFCAHAVASFAVQRLPHMHKTSEVLARNFSRTDLENLKEIFQERWPVISNDSDTENMGLDPLERQRPFTVTFSGGKSIYVLPLFSRDLLQGIIVLLWEYDRRIDNYRHMDDMMRIVAGQTALGLERHHLFTGVEKIGLTDELTGLSNRRMFNYLMEREISRSRRYGRPLSLVMIDIDHFKKINDTWGHPAGDMILRELSASMRANFRRLDVPVRYGGEEFAIILPETSLEEAIHFAERFRVVIEQSQFAYGKDLISVTISLGVASIGNSPVSEELDSDALLQFADRALYQAKQSGRNRIAAGRSC
ncbi:MAG TPA: sensor domain-containing diguanylate cyclase [Negativicutes bacterium]|nr:sensor domain-containing diguanylate cyclase [Negativicutes bacterium]